MIIRTYRELSQLETFKERFEYLKLNGSVGRETFGFDRYLNQRFYTSKEWREIRKYVIARDLGCDLGVEGYEIQSRVLIHHINPITPEDIELGNDVILNTDYLITTTHETHNAIHYGDTNHIPKQLVVRSPGDTKLW